MWLGWALGGPAARNAAIIVTGQHLHTPQTPWSATPWWWHHPAPGSSVFEWGLLQPQSSNTYREIHYITSLCSQYSSQVDIAGLVNCWYETNEAGLQRVSKQHVQIATFVDFCLIIITYIFWHIWYYREKILLILYAIFFCIEFDKSFLKKEWFLKTKIYLNLVNITAVFK